MQSFHPNRDSKNSIIQMPTIVENIENATLYHQSGHLQLAENLH